MNNKRFKLEVEFIELIKLLKYMNIAENGAHAKYLVDEGRVMVNGKMEHRKRRKLRKGDRVEAENRIIEIE